jgi:hypothetical protein
MPFRAALAALALVTFAAMLTFARAPEARAGEIARLQEETLDSWTKMHVYFRRSGAAWQLVAFDRMPDVPPMRPGPVGANRSPEGALEMHLRSGSTFDGSHEQPNSGSPRSVECRGLHDPAAGARQLACPIDGNLLECFRPRIEFGIG